MQKQYKIREQTIREKKNKFKFDPETERLRVKRLHY